MASAFETINGDHIHPHAFRGERMAHGGAFVNDGDTVCLEVLQVLLRIVSGSLHDRDT